jgi:hypothetical protein
MPAAPALHDGRLAVSSQKSLILCVLTLLDPHSSPFLGYISPAGSEQHAWVLSDLASVDRSVTPWVVVGGHRPMYIASTFKMPEWGDQTVAEDLRAAFEDAFVEHRVSCNVVQCASSSGFVLCNISAVWLCYPVCCPVAVVLYFHV